MVVQDKLWNKRKPQCDSHQSQTQDPRQRLWKFACANFQRFQYRRTPMLTTNCRVLIIPATPAHTKWYSPYSFNKDLRTKLTGSALIPGPKTTDMPIEHAIDNFPARRPYFIALATPWRVMYCVLAWRSWAGAKGKSTRESDCVWCAPNGVR